MTNADTASKVTKTSATAIIAEVNKGLTRSDIPDFRAGDTLKVHLRITEGQKERVQIFEGIVISRQGGMLHTATFTVRKVSFNIGVERTFLLHSPRIEKIELVSRGRVRRARLYYLRDLRGKSARIQSREMTETNATAQTAA